MGTVLAVLLVGSIIVTVLPKPVRYLGVALLLLNAVFYAVVYILHLTIS